MRKLFITISPAENGYQILVEPPDKPPFALNASSEAELHAQVQIAIAKVVPVPKRTPQELEAAADALDKEADMAETLMKKTNVSEDGCQHSEAYIAVRRSKAAALRKEAKQPKPTPQELETLAVAVAASLDEIRPEPKQS